MHRQREYKYGDGCDSHSNARENHTEGFVQAGKAEDLLKAVKEYRQMKETDLA